MCHRVTPHSGSGAATTLHATGRSGARQQPGANAAAAQYLELPHQQNVAGAFIQEAVYGISGAYSGNVP